MSVIVHDRLAGHVELHDAATDLRVLPALCPVTSSFADFSQPAELIDRSYRQSLAWLANGSAERATVYPPHHVHD
jgi:NTE family protein